LDEKELVARARSGDKKALETLLYDNYKFLLSFLLKLTMNEDTAKDFTQDVMVRAITHISSFSGSSKFSTWLISIASNAYKDSLRKNKRIADVEIEKLEIVDPDNVEEKVIINESMNNLNKSLLEIPEEKRKVFILKHFYNYSYEEISRILKCPIGTVRSRLHYCVKKLQELL
jgi:RNA polymerase sigma-70 factor (ECF subfamily)